MSRWLHCFAVLSAALVACGDPSPSPSAQANRPKAPTAVQALALVRSAEVSWAAPSSDGGSPVLSYIVTSSPGGMTETTEERHAVVSGLSDGTEYTFTVTAQNAAGVGPESAPSAAVSTPDKPGAPLGVAAVPGDKSVALAWIAPSSDGGSPITGYEVQIVPATDAAVVRVSGVTAAVTNIENGAVYDFLVRAVTEVGPGPWSEPSGPVSPAAGSSNNDTLAFAFNAPVDEPPVNGISFVFRLPEGVSVVTSDASTGEIATSVLQAGPAVPGTPVVMGALMASTRLVKVAVAVKPEDVWTGEFLRLGLQLPVGKKLTDADLTAIRGSLSDYKVVGFAESNESTVDLTRRVTLDVAFGSR